MQINLGVIEMISKKILAAVLGLITVLSCAAVFPSAFAAGDGERSGGAAVSFDTYPALYAHAVLNSSDTEAWQAWQCEHDEDFNEINSSVKYFFLPTSADDTEVDIYNAFGDTVSVNGVSIAPGDAKTVEYKVGTDYSVNADGRTYTLKFMKSNAEAAVYINNTDADGNNTELIQYLNLSKSNSASATGAIVNPDGTVDNTAIKKIKGRGNTTWDKPKKPYNITYSSAVSVGTMSKTKKFSLLANYQDDSLSRNRFLYDLSDAVGMPYASDSRYVDFYSDGYYWGSYLMAQKVDVGGSNLLNDIDETGYLNEDGTLNEDFEFVCEVDSSASWDDYSVKTASGNTITIKTPELSQGDVGYNEVKEYVKGKFDEMFTAIKGNTEDISQYVDVESVTKLYLINELGKNWDSGVSSLFFTYKQDENGDWKFYGSPVWDYDNSLGNAIGVESDLRDMGVSDYEEYTGWWCMYKGKSSRSRQTSNIMNYIARNDEILESAPEIWFEQFVPALDTFTQTGVYEGELYSSDVYYEYIKQSAEMNYQSGWLLDVGLGWISDHSSLKTASFDMGTGTYSVSSSATSYEQDFDGMYNYCVDWFTSRAAWLSSQMYDDYMPGDVMFGDVNLDGVFDISDATHIQMYLAAYFDLTDEQYAIAEINGDGIVDISDVTTIQMILAGYNIEVPINTIDN